MVEIMKYPTTNPVTVLILHWLNDQQSLQDRGEIHNTTY